MSSHHEKLKRSTPEPTQVKPYKSLYQLKIHLLDISPEVYRRFGIRADTTVVQMHPIVQLVMGWTNWHLPFFQIAGRRYGIDYTDGEPFLEIPQTTRLCDI
ncbi:plasmid pRiA4b ORF-3 family protein [Spirosoma taeanense]|uniref:Plasmid pRiA4b ORF-3 family protein n=1 Tax=Spirosoma taeanense TaxID=2735870 RepID=A0A6M5YG24_9BACT|nr:plasmid pRiA4b ORF-3 family protein [Spirosoma taeanense]